MPTTDISLESMYTRIAAMMDNLQAGTVTPEVADRIVKGADSFAVYAELELKMIALAWSRDRDVAQRGIMTCLIDPDDVAPPGLPGRVKKLNGGGR